MKLLLLLFFLFLSACTTQVMAQEMSISELRLIAQAGGSLIIDMDRRNYTVPELSILAEGLKFQATLTIKMGSTHRMNANQCAQIAKKRPGQVIFWF